MSTGRVKLQLVAFLALSGGVAANILLLQSNGRGSSESRVAQAPVFSFGDTGSITRAGVSEGEADRSRFAKLASDPAEGSAAAAQIPHDTTDVTRAVQRELQIRGYETGAADGVAGMVTRAAIMGFEYDHGLALSGNPSQQLLKYILLGDQGTPKRETVSGEQSAEAEAVIKSVQQSLARLGYRPGRASGRLTAETARAIREFEVDQALTESGRVSGPLVARLARLAGEGRIASGR